MGDFPMHRPVIRALTRRQVLTGYCRPKILPGGDAQLAMPLRTWRTKASLASPTEQIANALTPEEYTSPSPQAVEARSRTWVTRLRSPASVIQPTTAGVLLRLCTSSSLLYGTAGVRPSSVTANYSEMDRPEKSFHFQEGPGKF